MKAAVCHGFGEPLAVEDIDLDPPGPEEVRVRVAACAICHSDVAYASGAWGGRLPAVYGHEAAGVVEEVGREAEGIEAGDHVVVTLVRSCGSCHVCRRGQPALCATVFRLDEHSPLHAHDGAEIAQGLRTAAFAEQVLVHRSQVIPVPRELPLDRACLLACGVVTGYGAVLNTAQVTAMEGLTATAAAAAKAGGNPPRTTLARQSSALVLSAGSLAMTGATPQFALQLGLALLALGVLMAVGKPRRRRA